MAYPGDAWRDPSEHTGEDITAAEHAVLDSFYAGEGPAPYVEIGDLIGELREAVANLPADATEPGEWADDRDDLDKSEYPDDGYTDEGADREEIGAA